MDVATSLTSIEMRLAQARSRYDQGAGQLALLRHQRNEKDETLTRVKGNIDLWNQVQILLTKVSDYARRQLVERIEETVTAALQTVLADDSLRFMVEIGERNKQSTAEWRVVSRYAEVEISNNPEDARGGGIVDIVSLALRLALLELTRPRPEGLVVLDEIAKMVSVQYSYNLARFLKAYAQETGRQLLLVTHNSTLALSGDRICWVEKRDGVSTATSMTATELAAYLERFKEEEVPA